MKRDALLSISLLLASAAACAQQPASLPPYTPAEKVNGTLTVWGNDYMVNLQKRWDEGFRKFQPGIQFDAHLHSTATGMGGLYTGRAELAYMGRDSWSNETQGFTKTFGYDPTRFVVATGAYDVEGKTFPMVVLVNQANPLKGLNLQQLDAIFGTEHKLGAAKNARTWGDLGLTGDWADKPIHLYAYLNDSGFGVFFSAATMGASTRWNCDIQQFDNINNAAGKVVTPAGKRIAMAIAKDPYGLGYSGIRYASAEARAVPLATGTGTAYIAPTRENTINRTYPLIRDISIYINRVPGKPVDPKVREFLSYVFSREGQEAVTQEGDYIPVTVQLGNAERARLQ